MDSKFTVALLGLLCLTSIVLGQRQPNRPPQNRLPPVRQQPKPVEEENLCWSLPRGSGFLNDPSDCQSYFSCVNFEAHKVRCPGTLFFDPRRNICDLPQNVKCQVCPPTGIIGVAVATSCTQWILCVNGRETIQECAPGTHFSRVLERCDLAEFTPCFLNTCRDVRGSGLAPSPEKCEEYHYCSEGVQVSQGQCFAGMAFDIRTNRCVRERDGSCYPGSILRSIHPASIPLAANA